MLLLALLFALALLLLAARGAGAGPLPEAVLVPEEELELLPLVVGAAEVALGIFWLIRWTQSSCSIW
jgi:hypothetical protein